MKIEGLDVLQRILKVGGKQATTALAQALYSEATKIFMDSQAQVPVDVGALRASGNVSKPYIAGSTAMVEIGYGGAAAPYAAIVHENLEANHVVGKAKFLEDPLTQAIPNLSKAVTKSVQELLRKAS